MSEAVAVEEIPVVKLALSVKEVADALGVSESTVWRLSAVGELPSPVRVGRSVRWGRASLENWLAKRERKAKRQQSALPKLNTT